MLKYFLLIPLFLQAQVIETSKIEDVYGSVEEGTLVLIDMDSTITESTVDLGSSAWRHYIRSQGVPEELHDLWTYEIACKIPVRAVEEAMVEWIGTLQERDVEVVCFTARGRNHWYGTRIEGIDELSEKQLKMVGVDFSKSKVSPQLQGFNPDFFSRGVIYAYTEDKGEFLSGLLKETGYRPSKIIFIDDKESHVKSVDAVLTEAQIPHLCVWYRKVEEARKDFQPLLAAAQLEYFLETGKLPSADFQEFLKKHSTH